MAVSLWELNMYKDCVACKYHNTYIGDFFPDSGEYLDEDDEIGVLLIFLYWINVFDSLCLSAYTCRFRRVSGERWWDRYFNTCTCMGITLQWMHYYCFLLLQTQESIGIRVFDH